MTVHFLAHRVRCAALFVLLAACGSDAVAPVGDKPEPGGEQDSDTDPSTDRSTQKDAGAVARDAGKTGSRDAGKPGLTDAKVASEAGSQVSGGDAATSTDAAKGPVDDPRLDAGAGDASTSDPGVVDAGARKPSFQKTRCIDPSKVKADSELNFPCDDIDVWVVVPSACFEKACGLVFNIHGGGMSDHATMDQATNMIELGSRAGYIVVHPHKGTWSVGTDKNAVFGFMQQVIQAFDVDPKRVHSTGYSQGGQISWALGCEHADVIASIAPTEEINRVSDCWKTSKLPARELPVLFAYGKKDSIGGGYDAAKTLVNQFVTAGKMTGPESIAGKDGSTYHRQRWTSPTGNVLEFISQNYTSTGVGGILNGHCLPMASGDTFVSCAKPVDYDWGKEVIEFFLAHPKP